MDGSALRRLWIPMRCSRAGRQLVAVFELDPAGWLLTRCTAAGRGGGAGRIDVSGEFMVAADYPGCAACGNATFVRCGACGNLSCSQSEQRHFTCSWCERSGVIDGGVHDVRAADGSM